MEQQIIQPIVQSTADRSGRATAALVLGIVGLFASLVPIIGLPVQIIGLVLGIQSRKSTKRGLAIAGIVLCSIGIVFSVLSALLGVLLITVLNGAREKAREAQEIYNSVTPLPY